MRGPWGASVKRTPPFCEEQVPRTDTAARRSQATARTPALVDSPHNLIPGHRRIAGEPGAQPASTGAAARTGTEGASLPANLSGQQYRDEHGHSEKWMPHAGVPPTVKARPRETLRPMTEGEFSSGIRRPM